MAAESERANIPVDNITKNSPSNSEQQRTAAECKRANILRSQHLLCHDQIPVAWILKPDASRQLLQLLTKNDIEKYVAGCRHMKSTEQGTDENVNVAPDLAPSQPPPAPYCEDSIVPHQEVVEWRGYKCSFRSISYLDQIFHTHPKTFEGFRAKSEGMQRMVLDEVADLVKSLVGKRISQVTMDDINVAGQLLMDFKSMGLDVSWLEQRYTDVQASRMFRGLNEESAKILSELQLTDKCVMDLRRNLALEEAKVAALRDRAAALRDRCKDMAEHFSSRPELIDTTLSSKDENLKDLLSDFSHQPECCSPDTIVSL